MYSGTTLTKVIEEGQADIDIPKTKGEETPLETQCRLAYPLVGRTINASDLIGHSGEQRTSKMVNGKKVVTLNDHNFIPHLHFEIYWRSDGVYYYLNPEYYLKISGISYSY